MKVSTYQSPTLIT